MGKKEPKFTDEQVKEIRETYIGGAKVPFLAEYYGCSTFSIYSVLNYKSPYDADKPDAPILRHQFLGSKRGKGSTRGFIAPRGSNQKRTLVTRSELDEKTKAMSARWEKKPAAKTPPPNQFICPHCLGSGMLVPKNMSLGQLFLFHRHRLNLTSKEVHKKTNVSDGTISMLERDKIAEPKFSTIWPLIQLYGIDPSELPEVGKVTRIRKKKKA